MFKNLQQRTLFKRVLTPQGEGTVSHGVYYPPEFITSYKPFTGDWYSYQSGNKSESLPEGVTSSDVITLVTGEDLNTDKDLYSEAHKSDYIYLINPEDNPDTPAYKCYKKKTYLADPAFKFLTEDYFLIDCIRQEKGTLGESDSV